MAAEIVMKIANMTETHWLRSLARSSVHGANRLNKLFVIEDIVVEKRLEGLTLFYRHRR